MAIEKEIKQPSNIITTYHKLEDIQGIFSSGLCKIVIGNYLNSESRFNGASPVSKTTLSLRLPPDLHSQIKKLLYEILPFPYNKGKKIDPDNLINLIEPEMEDKL